MSTDERQLTNSRLTQPASRSERCCAHHIGLHPELHHQMALPHWYSRGLPGSLATIELGADTNDKKDMKDETGICQPE
jgi:hypothetical protein